MALPRHFPRRSRVDASAEGSVSKTDPASPWRDCVTDRILYFEGRLGDVSLSTAERAMALKLPRGNRRQRASAVSCADGDRGSAT